MKLTADLHEAYREYLKARSLSTNCSRSRAEYGSASTPQGYL